jgi:carbon starvation protein
MWNTLLLLYCLGAGVVPVWLLLQPRGQLGGYFLYAALLAGGLGLLFGGGTIQYPAVREPIKWVGAGALFPFLFIMIACGACSGFHSLIASGTTSKQLKVETDAKVVGYGAMLMEAMVAIVSLCCVMMFAEGSPQLDPKKPNLVYAQGIGQFVFLVSQSNAVRSLGIAFALMAFTTFVYDTLDVCTRLGRYIIQELTGLHNHAGRWLGTGLTAGVPLYFLLTQSAAPGTDPLWKVFWQLFGASNQLLAALTLLGITVWLWQTRRALWVWFVTGIPTVVMYVMSTWALVVLTVPKFRGAEGNFVLPREIVPWIGLALMILALLMLIEAIIVLTSLRKPPQSDLKPALAT